MNELYIYVLWACGDQKRIVPLNNGWSKEELKDINQVISHFRLLNLYQKDNPPHYYWPLLMLNEEPIIGISIEK